MNESTLFGMKSKCDNVYPLLQVFQVLLLYPCFMIRNPYRSTGSSLSGLLKCKKDVFYLFMSNPQINWRKSVYYLTLRLWSRIRLRSGRKEGTVCLIVDDTGLSQDGTAHGEYRQGVLPCPTKVSELFELTNEDNYQAIINREEDMKHICDFYRLKLES